MATDDRRARLRALPSVDRLATAVARAELEERRAELLAGADDKADLVDRARERLRSSMRRVLNATGVIVHTNLGRAPLADPAREAVADAAHGYANLELDLGTGERGSRQDHVQGLLLDDRVFDDGGLGRIHAKPPCGFDEDGGIGLPGQGELFRVEAVDLRVEERLDPCGLEHGLAVPAG